MFYKRYAIHELGTEIGQARKRSPGVLKDIAIKIEAHGTISGDCKDDRAPDQPRDNHCWSLKKRNETSFLAEGKS